MGTGEGKRMGTGEGKRMREGGWELTVRWEVDSENGTKHTIVIK